MKSHAQTGGEAKSGEAKTYGGKTDERVLRQPSQDSPVLDSQWVGSLGLEVDARKLSRLSEGAPSGVAPFLLGLQQGKGNRYVQRVMREASQAKGEVAPEVQSDIDRARGGGQPLPNNVRLPMETAFQTDFSGVRVHTDERSNQLNSAVDAVGTTPVGALLTEGLPSRSSPPVQRQCACGGRITLGGECEKCRQRDAETTRRFTLVSSPDPKEHFIQRQAEPGTGVAVAPPPSTPQAPAGAGPPSSSPTAGSPIPSVAAKQTAPAATSKTSGTQGKGSGTDASSQSNSSAPGAQPPAPGSPSNRAAAGPGAADPAKAGAAAPAAAAILDTSSAQGLLESLASTPASAFNKALTQATAAAPGIQAQEMSELQASLPEIEQPTGLPVKGAEKPAPGTALPRGGPAQGPPVANATAPTPVAATPPVASGPLPAAHVSTKVAEPAEDSGGSWWDWLFGKVKSFVGSLPTTDPGISTSAGERPKVDLTGDADPSQNAEYEQSSKEQVSARGKESDEATAKDFGERGIYPTIATQKLRAKTKPTPAPGVQGNIPQPRALPAEDLAQFDEGATPLLSAQVEEQVAKHRQDEETYQKKSAEARADGEKRIADETLQARNQQEALRSKARIDVDAGREQWRTENRQIQEQFSAQSSAKHAEIDKQIKDKTKTADEQAETELANAEKTANEERSKAEAKAEAKKKEAEDKPKSWWERVKGAVSDAFDSIRDAVNDIFDELRSLVKSIIDKAKKLVTGLIELARKAIVGLIKAFGEFVKGLVTIALAAFPEAAAKARAWIDDKVATATEAVNKAAEVLKAAAEAILDAVGAVLDAALAVLQASFNAAFRILEFLAKLPFMAIDALGKLIDLLRNIGPFLDAAKKIMDDPSIITDGIKSTIGGMIADVPGRVANKVQEFSEQLGGQVAVKTPGPAPSAPASARSQVIQRQPDPAASAAPVKRNVPASVHLKGIWRHLTAGLAHLKSSWWEELKKVGWNLLWPWPAVWGDLKEIWNEIKLTWAAVKALKGSEAIDHILAIGQKFNSILGNLYGWFFIASVLIGTIIGAFFGGAGAIPGFFAGVAFAGAVGEGLLAGLLAVEGSIILKGVADLVIGNDTQEKDEADYDKIAGSTLTLAITGALMVIGEIAAKLAKSIWEGASGLLGGEKAPEVDVKVDTPESKGKTPDKAAEPDTPGSDTTPPELVDGERVVAEADDGHVKVTESGRCLICTTCEEVGVKFRDELNTHSDLRAKLNDAKATENPAEKAEKIANLEKDLSEARQKAREGETPEQKALALSDIQNQAKEALAKAKEKLANAKPEVWKGNPSAQAELEVELRDLEEDLSSASERAKEASGDPKKTDAARETLDDVRAKAELLENKLDDLSKTPEPKSPDPVAMEGPGGKGKGLEEPTVKKPTPEVHRLINQYVDALNKLRDAIEDNDGEAQQSARKDMDEIEHAALENAGKGGPLDQLLDHIDTLTDARSSIEKGTLRFPMEEPPHTGKFVEGIGRKFDYLCAKRGLKGGMTYSDVETIMGWPPTRPPEVRPNGAARLTWQLTDGSLVHLDVPGPENISPYEVNRNPHLALTAPSPYEQLHMSEDGIGVPSASTPAHIEVKVDAHLNYRLNPLRGNPK